MKVLLIRYHNGDNINSRFPESLVKKIGIVPPLGIAYIASALEKNNHTVKILDCIALNLTKEETSRELSQFDPDLVGITAMIDTIKGAFEAARLTKQYGKTVVLGGPAVSAYPEEIMQSNFIDYCIIGEAEYSFPDLIDALENKKSLNNIKGLVYRKNNQIKINNPDLILDLDKLPFPARHLLPIEKYSIITSTPPLLTVLSSRGCPYNCSFCYPLPNHKLYRTRTPKNFVDEIEMLVNDYKAKEIMILDDTFVINRQRVVSICKEIIARKLDINWESPTRVDKMDQELLALMAKSGCKRLRYGVESGDPTILESMNKSIELEKVRQVFKMTKKAGIETFAYFIIGYLNDTPQTMKRTIEFAKELNPDLLMFNIATPLPKTRLFDEAVKAGIIDKDYWPDYLLNKTTKRMPYLAKDTEKYFKKAHRSFYFRPSYIMKRFKKIRSLRELRDYANAAIGLVFMGKEGYNETS